MWLNQEATILVEYKLLSKGRHFAFNSLYSVVYHVVVTLEIAKVMVVCNPTRGLLKILKRTRIGTIEETYDSGFLATS